MQRHGWKETGRQVGQHGCGFQFGACHGSGMKPLEQTDADALVVLAQLVLETKRTRAALAVHTAGEDTYRHTFKVARWSDSNTREDASKASDALRVAGYTFDKEETQEGGGRRSSSRLAVRFTVEVPRGAVAVGGYYDAAKVPAWETLRAQRERELADMVKALEEQRVAIKAAVAHHAANPSNGGEDPHNRGPAMHLKRTWIIPADRCYPGTTEEARTRTVIECSSRGMRSTSRCVFRTTAVEAEVTCARCLKGMATRVKDAEKRAEKVAKKAAKEEARYARLQEEGKG
jgi:hypothetical protein